MLTIEKLSEVTGTQWRQQTDDLHLVWLQLLLIDNVDLDSINNLWRLGGRGRLFGGLFYQLHNGIKENPILEKSTLLTDAIDDRYNATLEQLVSRIKGAIPKPATEHGMKEQSTLPSDLTRIALSALWGGYVAVAASDQIDIDFLNIGLCAVKPVDSNKYSLVLDEQLGRDAIVKVAMADKVFSETFQKLGCFSQQSLNHGMEPLFVSELMKWSAEPKNATVRDFLGALYDDLPENIPSWVEGARFDVKGGFNRANFPSKQIKDDIHFVEKALNDDEFRDTLLSPSTEKRPDFEAVMNGVRGSVNDLWFLTISSKLVGRTYDDRYEYDLLSTSPEYFYRKKNGTENQNFSKLRDRWETLTNQHRSTFSRCVRIHLCLPDVKRPLNATERIWVEKDGSIVVYITKDNAARILQPATIDYLKRTGYLPTH